MALGTKIVIDNTILYKGEIKKYRSTAEQIRQNEEEKKVQRERDARAQDQASDNSGATSHQAAHEI